jgi:hypothetical protein
MADDGAPQSFDLQSIRESMKWWGAEVAPRCCSAPSSPNATARAIKDLDGRDKPGHDESSASYVCCQNSADHTVRRLRERHKGIVAVNGLAPRCRRLSFD